MLKICAVTTGTKCHNNNGMLKGIPSTLYLSIGMDMRLTCNINPKHMLYNQQKGTIVDIIYEPDVPASTFGHYKTDINYQ